jgi:hypothetical protein
MEFCKICNEIDWQDGKHRCLPFFDVWFLKEGEQESARIYARDAEEAAEKFAEYDDQRSADYAIVSGNEAEIWVREPTTGEIKKFMVHGESVPKYHADEIKP